MIFVITLLLFSFEISFSFVDSIRYGENLSLVFKCTHRENKNDSLEMKHIYLANDNTMKDKYVNRFFKSQRKWKITKKRLFFLD